MLTDSRLEHFAKRSETTLKKKYQKQFTKKLSVSHTRMLLFHSGLALTLRRYFYVFHFRGGNTNPVVLHHSPPEAHMIAVARQGLGLPYH